MPESKLDPESTLVLDPDLWDRTPKDEREVVLRGALLGGFNLRRDWLLPQHQRKRDIKAEEVGETLERVKKAWAEAEERLSRKSNIRPIKMGVKG